MLMVRPEHIGQPIGGPNSPYFSFEINAWMSLGMLALALSIFLLYNRRYQIIILLWEQCSDFQTWFGFVCFVCVDPPSRRVRSSCRCRPPVDRRLRPADTASSTAARSPRWCHATACRCARRCTDSRRPARRRSSRSFLSATFRRSWEACRKRKSERLAVGRGETQETSSLGHAA